MPLPLRLLLCAALAVVLVANLGRGQQLSADKQAPEATAFAAALECAPEPSGPELSDLPCGGPDAGPALDEPSRRAVADPFEAPRLSGGPDGTSNRGPPRS